MSDNPLPIAVVVAHHADEPVGTVASHAAPPHRPDVTHRETDFDTTPSAHHAPSAPSDTAHVLSDDMSDVPVNASLAVLVSAELQPHHSAVVSLVDRSSTDSAKSPAVHSSSALEGLLQSPSFPAPICSSSSSARVDSAQLVKLVAPTASSHPAPQPKNLSNSITNVFPVDLVHSSASAVVAPTAAPSTSSISIAPQPIRVDQTSSSSSRYSLMRIPMATRRRKRHQAHPLKDPPRVPCPSRPPLQLSLASPPHSQHPSAHLPRTLQIMRSIHSTRNATVS
jgi:hypothetical protein